MILVRQNSSYTKEKEVDGVIASTTVSLAARTLSLETTYIGRFEFAANRYPPIVREMDLLPGHKVFSILGMGSSKLKFLRTVDRKPMKARWL
jgi:hypothetical protein